MTWSKDLKRGGAERKTRKRMLAGMVLLVFCLLCVSGTACADSRVVKATSVTEDILKQLQLKKVDRCASGRRDSLGRRSFAGRQIFGGLPHERRYL